MLSSYVLIYTACACYNDGSVSNFCDINSGECKCKSNFGGKNCNKCSDGYYGFPTCSCKFF